MAKAEDSPQFVEALEALEASAGEWTTQCEDAVARVEACRAAMRARMEPDERALREILEPPRIKSFGSVTLYPNRIVMNGVVRQLAPGVQTLAETRGNINRAKRSLLTRTAVGVFTFPMAAGLGFFATPKTKKHDDREVVLIVEGSDWAEMTTYGPALQRDVVRFAKEIEATADAWMTGQGERAPRVAALAGRIRDIQDESADLDEALDHLDAVRAEPATRDALDRVQTLIADEDLKVSRDIRKRIEAVQATVGRLGAVPPPPPRGGKSSRKWRPITMADLRTDPLGLAVRRSANDVARSLGRWQSNPAEGPSSDAVLPLEELLVMAEMADTPSALADDAATSPPPAADDTVEALGRLAEMHSAGVLTDEEFAAAKARLLGT